MMMRKMGFAEMAASILDALRQKTAYDCYDAVPEDAPSPLVFVEVIGKRDSSTKTMYKETFVANLHLIAMPGDSRLEIYRMIQDVEEALTEHVVVPKNITLVMQTETGVNAIQQDETREYHAVIGYEYMVSYGFKSKI